MHNVFQLFVDMIMNIFNHLQLLYISCLTLVASKHGSLWGKKNRKCHASPHSSVVPGKSHCL